MQKAFSVSPTDKTISVHQDNMNPNEIRELIKSLRGHLALFCRGKTDPIDILVKSVRNYGTHLTFCLSWTSDKITVNCDTDFLPPPNVYLTDSQMDQYKFTLWTMIEASEGTNG